MSNSMERVFLVKLIVMILLLASLVGCQTLVTNRSRQLTKDEKKYFHSCENMSGDFQVKLSKKREVVLESYMEWQSSIEGFYSLAFVSPIGNDILRFEAQDHHLSLSGLDRFKNISILIDQDGFLKIAGRWLGIKSKEIPCLLKGQIPLEWLEKSRIWQKKERQDLIEVNENWRSINITFYYNKKRELERKCINIFWNMFWIFKKYKIKICYDSFSEEKVKFNFNDRYHLRLFEADHS